MLAIVNLTISYHILPYLTISYHILPYLTISYQHLLLKVNLSFGLFFSVIARIYIKGTNHQGMLVLLLETGMTNQGTLKIQPGEFWEPAMDIGWYRCRMLINVVQDLFHFSKIWISHLATFVTFVYICIHLFISVSPAFPARFSSFLFATQAPKLATHWPWFTCPERVQLSSASMAERCWEALVEVAEEGTFYNWLLLEPLRPYFGHLWATGRLGFRDSFCQTFLGLGQAGGSPNAGARS